MIRLSALEPNLKEGFLSFWCPVCRDDSAHKIRVPLAPTKDRYEQSWQHSGECPDTLTLTPSVDAGCWHGYIQNGELTNT